MITKNERPVNIKDLVVDEPNTDRYGSFDPRLLFSEKRQQQTVALLNTEILKNYVDSFALLESIYTLLKLFPEKSGDLKFKTALQQKIIQTLNLNDHKARPVTLMYANFIFPEDIEISSDIQKQIKADFENVDKNSGWLVYNSNLLLGLKAYSPEIFHSIFSKSSWDKMERELRFTNDTKNVVRKAKLAAHMRLLDPKRYEEIKLNRAFWETAKDEIQNTSNGLLCLDLALNVQILRAKAVRLTKQGVEFTLPESQLDGNTPPLPEARRF